MKKRDIPLAIFLANIAIIALCIVYATYMEHRCNRCLSYAIAFGYVLLPIGPLIISGIGTFYGFKVKSKIGIGVNAVMGTLILLLFVAFISVASQIF